MCPRFGHVWRDWFRLPSGRRARICMACDADEVLPPYGISEAIIAEMCVGESKDFPVRLEKRLIEVLNK